MALALRAIASIVCVQAELTEGTCALGHEKLLSRERILKPVSLLLVAAFLGLGMRG